MKLNLINKLAASTVALGLILLAACNSNHDNHDHEHDGHEQHDHDHDKSETEEEHHHDGAVEIEPEKAQKFGIKVEKVTPGSFSEVIRVSGRVEPAASDRMTVTARQSGIFHLSSGITTGSKVNVGQLIGSISSKGVQGGDVNSAAIATLKAAQREVDRLTPLYKDGLVTASVYNEARRNLEEAKAMTQGPTSGNGAATAPCSGTITDIYVASGQFVEVGAQIAVVARNSQLTLRADVPEKYVGVIPGIVSANFRPDYTATTFSLSSLGGRRLSGSSAAATNGYIPIYFTFNSNGEIVPGAFAEIYLLGAPRKGVITVPREALIEMQGNKYVYVREHGHAYEKRLVTTGASDGRRIEILSGIKPGEEVVSHGATVVRMTETSAIAPPGHTHNH